MLLTTRKVGKQLQLLTKHVDRLKMLRDRARGNRCVLLGCGSSLQGLKPELLQKLGSDIPVIAIKQAYIPLASVVDYHLVSRYKYVNYAYGKRRPVVLAFTQKSRPFRGVADILMPLHNGGNFAKSVTSTHEFDKWRMDQSFDRCCGPGMVYEMGLYLAVHLGVKEILTVGVDFDSAKHFYSDNTEIRKLVRRKGKLHGKDKEQHYMVKGIPLWNNWLRKQGITWRFLDIGQQTPLRDHLATFVLT
jgi:hypothetical protein